MDKYYDFILKGKKELVDSWIDQLDTSYAAGNSGLVDQTYDHFIQLYESRFGKRTVVGSKPTHNSVQLPIAMMSLDKIMKEKELQSFTNKNIGPYIVMDKINGNAGLYEIKFENNITTINLYNRGNGTEGSDLSHILPYLNLPVLKYNIHVKGELVIYKTDYDKFKTEYKTNLSMINGLLNSQSPDPEKLKLFHFIAYDLSFQKQQDISLTMSKTLEYLVNYGFQVPYNIPMDTLSIDCLSTLFKKRKTNALYDVDGIVIVHNRNVNYSERLIRQNPKYMVAFKEYGDTAVATVSHVVWEASKNNMIKPVVKIYPVTLNSFTIKSLTAFNAGWIIANNVGPGTKLIITHNTIPYILSVIKPTIAQLPPKDVYPDGSWVWNNTKVDIILLEDNNEVKIAKIYDFFKQIDVKYLGESTISKFYQAGFNTIKKMLETTKEQFMAKKIEGIGEGIIDRIIKSITEALPLVTLSQLMSASGVFGIGFGNKKITLITETYPDIFNMNPTVDEIEAIKGFAIKTAKRFVSGLHKFREFINDIPILLKVLRGELTPKIKQIEKVKHIKQISIQPNNDNNLIGKSVVFTGFRDKVLETNIKASGGKVTTGVSRKTNYLIVGGVKGKGSGKETKALEYGIPVYNILEFKTMFGL